MTVDGIAVDIKVMRLQDDDIVVLHVDKASIDEVVHIGKALKAVVGDHPILILEGDMNIEVLRPEQLPPALRNL